MKTTAINWREDRTISSFKIWGKITEHKLFVIWENKLPNIKRGFAWKMYVLIGDENKKPIFSDEIADLKKQAQNYLNSLAKDLIEDAG